MFGVPASRLRREMSEREFREYQAYFDRVPLPGDRLDWHFTNLLAAVLSPHRKKGSPPPDPKKLHPNWWKEPEPPKVRTTAEWRSLLKGLCLAMGGEVAGEKEPAGRRSRRGRR